MIVSDVKNNTKGGAIMKKYLGKGVYGAVAIGKISVFKKCDAAVTRIHVEDTALLQHFIDQRRLAVVNVCDNRYIS